MTRARQRVVARRRMQQRIETIADDTQYNHSSRASTCSSGRLALQTRRNAPFIFAPPCQSRIKRTLRQRGRLPNTACSRGFRAPYEAHSTRMVNVGFPARWRYGFEKVDAPERLTFPCTTSSIENLHRIKSFAFSLNFRRTYLNADTSDLSTAVSQ